MMKVKDLAKINEKNIGRNYEYSNIEYIDTASVNQGSIDSVQHLTLREAPSRAKRIVKRNDILISTVRPSLKHFALVKNPSVNTIASTGFAVISCKKIFPYYLYYYLTTDYYTDFLASIAESQQSNYPAFNPSLIGKTEINPPSGKIQKKIAAILIAYDDLIEINNRRIQILEKMTEEIYREWFVRMRFPEYEKTKFFKGKPADWKIIYLNEIAEETSKSTTGGQHLSDRFYLPIELFGSKKFLPIGHFDYSEAKSSLILFDKGDILFGAMRPYLHKVILSPFKGVTRTTSFVIQPKSQSYYSYLFLLLFQDSTIEYATLIANGSDRPYVVWNHGLERMKIYKPPDELLVQFNKIVKPMLNFILNEYNILQNLIKTRDLLLNRLISGKLSVENLNIKFPPSMEEVNA